MSLTTNLASENYYWKRVIEEYPSATLFGSSTVTLDSTTMPNPSFFEPRLDTWTNDSTITAMAALARFPALAYDANLITTKNPAGIYAF